MSRRWASLGLTVINAVGQVGSFVLLATIAYLYGVSSETDAFFLALSVPTLFIGPVVNSIQSVLVPILTSLRTKAPSQVADLAGSAILHVAVLGVAAAVVIAAVAPLAVTTFHIGPPEIREAIVRQTWLLAPITLLQTASGAMQAVLNADGRLMRPALAFSARHLTALLVLLVSHRALGSMALSLAFVCGSALQTGWLAWQLRSLRSPVRLSLNRPEGFRHSMGVAGPLIISSACLQAGVFLSRLLASSLPEGSVTILDYGARLTTGVIELVGSGVLLVSMVRWAELAALDDLARLTAAVRRTVRAATAVLLPLAAIIIVSRNEVIAMLLARGSVRPEDALAMASILGILALTIPVEVLGRLHLRLFLAWHDSRSMAILSVVRVVSLTAFALVLRGPLGVNGIAIAECLSVASYVTLVVRWASRRLDASVAPGWWVPAQYLLAAIVAGLAGGWVHTTLSRQPWLLVATVPALAVLAVFALGVAVLPQARRASLALVRPAAPVRTP